MKRLSQYIHKLISFSKVIHLVSAVRFLDRSEGADQFKVEYSMKQMHLPRVGCLLILGKSVSQTKVLLQIILIPEIYVILNEAEIHSGCNIIYFFCRGHPIVL